MPAKALSTGYIFAATGQLHITLARRAARTLRAVSPDAAVDLFTDDAPDDPVFDQVHSLNRSSHRPKIEALRRSRFDRTLYLDTDVAAVAPVDDIFTVLDRFDLTAVQENRRDGRSTGDGTPELNAFPQINSGVLGIRKSPQTEAFLQEWEAAVLDTGAKRDQPALRGLLWETDLRVHVLPIEYNLMDIRLLRAMGLGNTAPRLLHRPMIKRLPHHNPNQPFGLDEIMKPHVAEQLRKLLQSDRTLGPAPDRERVWEPAKPAPKSLLRRLLSKIRA